MRELSTYLTLTDEVIRSPNVADLLNEDTLAHIGREVVEGFKIDKDSRARWEKRTDAALNLAMQLQEDKTFPWPGCANVRFPLVTVAAMQWHSRAYPTLLQGPHIVRMGVNGPDPQGKLAEQSTRIADFMSYQLLEDSPSWEEETDRLLLQVPIVGCAFKKTYHSAAEGRNVSELVSARDFVINYWAKSIDTAQRKTHCLPFHRNEVYEKCMAEVWRDVRNEQWYGGVPPPRTDYQTARTDKRTGMNQPMRPDDTTPFWFLEQHVRMDLDGDGYAEPYVITVEEQSGCVVRIVCNFEPNDILRTKDRGGDIIRIRETQWFTKFPCIPSPDGGFYDVGFGLLLGPINESVNSIVNQLLDAGTLATTAGGFLGRGVKIRGGEYSFRPFGWQRVDSTGDDLAKGVYPFPVREPSNVLFSLLSLLVDYANRITGATDIMVGENPGQNTPAETSRLMAEQGAKINAAIFKRVWRAFKEEFQKLYRLNKVHLPIAVTTYGQQSGWIRREDFTAPDEALRPAADPNLASDTQKLQTALMLKQNSMTTPGYNREAVERRMLRAMKVEDIDAVYPGPDKVPPLPNPKVQLEQLKEQNKLAIAKMRQQEKIAEIMSNRETIAAEIALVKAQTAQIIAEIGEARAASQLKAFEAQLKALTDLDKSYQAYLELAMKATEGQTDGQGSSGGMAPQSGNASVQGRAPQAA